MGLKRVEEHGGLVLRRCCASSRRATATRRSPRIDLSVRAVEVHKANAVKGLGITSRVDIVRYASLQGWLQDN